MQQKYVFQPGTTVFVPKADKAAIPHLKQYGLTRKLRRNGSGWDVYCYATADNLDEVFVTRQRKRGIVLQFRTEAEALSYALVVPEPYRAAAKGNTVQVHRAGDQPDTLGFVRALNRGEREFKLNNVGRYIRSWAKRNYGISVWIEGDVVRW